MSIQSYRVPANDYTSKMAQKIASRVSKKAKIFRQKCLSPLSEPKNARKKCVLEHFEAFLTESTPFFQESRVTEKNHPDFAACLERSRYQTIGWPVIYGHFFESVFFDSRNVSDRPMYYFVNVLFCICLHSHALIRGLRVFELSHLRLHLRLIPLILRDQLRNGGTPPY